MMHLACHLLSHLLTISKVIHLQVLAVIIGPSVRTHLINVPVRLSGKFLDVELLG